MTTSSPKPADVRLSVRFCVAVGTLALAACAGDTGHAGSSGPRPTSTTTMASAAGPEDDVPSGNGSVTPPTVGASEETPPTVELPGPTGEPDPPPQSTPKSIGLLDGPGFESGSAVLTPEGIEALRAHVGTTAAKHRILRVDCHGHTDDLDPDGNQALSEERARACEDAIRDLPYLDGVEIVARGFAFDHPLCSEQPPDEECRAKNRRVELTLWVPTDTGGTER